MPQSVFITGASSGIGAALARAWIARGARVGCFARRPGALESLQQSAGAGRVSLHPGDVRDADSVARAAVEFVGRFGIPDVVVANAGVSRGTATEVAEDLPVFRAILETNVLGVVHAFQPFLPAMTRAGRGVLVGVASVAGFRGLPGSSAYCASKAAVITYLESLRVELRGSGVDVITVCPGYVATPMTARNPYPMPFRLSADEAARRIVRGIEARRRFLVVPWQMGVVGCVLRWLPRPLFDAVFSRAPRKPRDLPI